MAKKVKGKVSSHSLCGMVGLRACGERARQGGPGRSVEVEAREQQHCSDEQRDARAGDKDTLEPGVDGGQEGDGENCDGGQDRAAEPEPEAHDRG